MGPSAGTPVSAILSRSVRTIGPDERLWFARDLMRTHRIRHLVVVDHDRVVGVVSDRDVLAAVSPVADRPSVARSADLATLERRVHQIMTRNPITVRAGTSVEDATRLLLEHRIHSLPVVDERDRCVGLLTDTDVLRWGLEQSAQGTIGPEGTTAAPGTAA